MTRSRLGWLFLVGLGLLTAIFLFSRSRTDPRTESESTQLDPMVGADGGLGGQSSRVQAIDNVKRPPISAEMPKPNQRFRLGEPIRVKGRLVIPDGYWIFDKKVTAGTITRIQGSDVLDSSSARRLQPVDERTYEFDFTLEGPDYVPKRPGSYRLQIVASDVELEGDVAPDHDEDRSLRFDPNHYPRLLIPYEVIK